MASYKNVLLAAVSLVIWSLRNEGSAGACIGKFFGIIVAALAIFGILCTLYYGFIYWQQGAFNNPMSMMGAMHGKMMMGGEMQSKNIMQGDMKGKGMMNEGAW